MVVSIGCNGGAHWIQISNLSVRDSQLENDSVHNPVQFHVSDNTSPFTVYSPHTVSSYIKLQQM